MKRMKLEGRKPHRELPARPASSAMSPTTPKSTPSRSHQGEVRQGRYPRPRRRLRPPNELRGDFLNTTRDGFRIAMDVSVYSLVRRQPRRRAAHDRWRQHHDPQLLRR